MSIQQSTGIHAEHRGLSIAMMVGVVADVVYSHNLRQTLISLIVHEKQMSSLIKVMAGQHVMSDLRPLRAADLVGAVVSVRGRLEGTHLCGRPARDPRTGREHPLRFIASKVEVLIASDKTKPDSTDLHHATSPGGLGSPRRSDQPAP